MEAATLWSTSICLTEDAATGTAITGMCRTSSKAFCSFRASLASVSPCLLVSIMDFHSLDAPAPSSPSEVGAPSPRVGMIRKSRRAAVMSFFHLSRLSGQGSTLSLSAVWSVCRGSWPRYLAAQH